MTLSRRRGLSALQKDVDLAVALVLTALVVFLSFKFYTHAGPLWRDEASTVHLATQPRYSDVLASLHLDSAPALFPTLLRLWSMAGWTDDVALRYLGFLIAMATVAVVWMGAKSLALPTPLLTLALFNAHGVVIQTAGSLKPYGLGTVFALLVFSTLWRMISRPTVGTTASAVMASVLAVQTTYHNAVFVFTVCLAAMAAKAISRDWTAVRLALATGFLAAASLLPYTGTIIESLEWRRIQVDPGLGRFDGRLIETLSWNRWLAVIWGVACLAAVLAAVLILARPSHRPRLQATTERLAYASVTMIGALVAYFAFFALVGRSTEPWHLAPLIGLVAFCIEIPLAERPPFRWVRLGTAVIAFAVMFPLSLGWAGVRQTNVDLIATYLQDAARKGDLIVVEGWFVGITFKRYYGGDAEWMTIPPIEDLRIHRYDLVKERMMAVAPLAPVHRAIRTALESGHRVWVVGGLDFPRDGEVPIPLPPAPSAKGGWREGAYYAAWSRETGHFVKIHSLRLDVVRVRSEQPVWAIEAAPLLVAEGWRDR